MQIRLFGLLVDLRFSIYASSNTSALSSTFSISCRFSRRANYQYPKPTSVTLGDCSFNAIRLLALQASISRPIAGIRTAAKELTNKVRILITMFSPSRYLLTSSTNTSSEMTHSMSAGRGFVLARSMRQAKPRGSTAYAKMTLEPTSPNNV